MSDPGPVVGRLDHVGIACGPARHPVEHLLEPMPQPVAMPSGVLVARSGGVELVRAGRPGSPVERFLERQGPGLHHLALAVPAPLEDALASLALAGLVAVGAPEPGSDGRRTVFLHPRTAGGVLIELVEEA